MKKRIVFALCLALLLSGCVTQAPPETTAPPTVAPTTTPAETTAPTTVPTEPAETEPPVPETVAATALADHVALVIATVNRGDTVEIAGELDDTYYIVKLENGYGLLEKRLLRPEGEAEYETWAGYAKSGAMFCDNYHLISLGAQKLSQNTKLTVLDQMGDTCLVQVDETIGYLPLSKISKTYIKSSGSSSSDGGDISLSNQPGLIPLSVFVPQEGDVTGSATVLCDGAEIMLGWFDRNDTIPVITEEGFAEVKDGWHAVYLDGVYGYVRQNLTAMEGAEPYTPWEGYAKGKTGAYTNYYLTGEPAETLGNNTKVTVLYDLEFCYLVQIGDNIRYLDKELVSQKKWSSGSSGSAEWSDPVM